MTECSGKTMRSSKTKRKYIERKREDGVNKNTAVIILTVIFIFALFIVGPIISVLRPDLSDINITELDREVVLQGHSYITLYGKNIDEIDSLFVNGQPVKYTLIEDDKKKEESEEETTEEEGEHINIQFDLTPFSGKKQLSIQVGKNVAGIVRIKSKKCRIKLYDEEHQIPQITAVNYEEITYPHDDFLLQVEAEGVNQNSFLLLNGEEIQDTIISDDNTYCETIVTAGMLEKSEDSLEVQLGQYSSSGMQTKVVSNVYSIPISQMNYEEFEHSYDWIGEETQIMHALGAYQGETYTNSMEALNESMKGGANIFELDIIFDQNGKLVGRHDWSEELLKSNQAEIEPSEMTGMPLSYEELKKSLKNKYTVVSFEDIVKFLSENPQCYIVTDTKYEDEVAVTNTFEEIVRVCKEYDEKVLEQIIVQVYSENMYAYLMKVYPFQSVIYTLYKSENTEDEVISFINYSNIKAVTFPAESNWDNDEFIQKLLDCGCYLFVHTINDYQIEKGYLEKGISGVYTDTLTPNAIAEAAKQESNRLQEAENIKNETDVHEYLKKLKDSEFTILISARDDASDVNGMEEDLISMGLEPKVSGAFRESYIAVIDNQKVKYENISENVLNYSYMADTEHQIKIESAGNECGNNASILINGVECAGNLRGLNIVVLDSQNNEVVDSSVIDNFEDAETQFLHISTDEMELPVDAAGYIADRKQILNYLKDINDPNFVVMMVVQDEATSLVDDEIMEAMSQIGISKEYQTAFRKSYLAIFDGKNQVIQQFGEEKKLDYVYAVDNNRFELISGGNGSGVQASIVWNGQEMAEAERGLHILVYNKLIGKVISYCRMDLFGTLKCEITDLDKENYK